LKNGIAVNGSSYYYIHFTDVSTFSRFEFKIKPNFILEIYNWGNDSAKSGSGSSVGMAIGYGLDVPGIESQWGGRDFPQLSRPALDPPSLLYNEYRVFPGGSKRPGHDADPSPPSSAEV
jgi:hypothetical protein